MLSSKVSKHLQTKSCISNLMVTTFGINDNILCSKSPLCHWWKHINTLVKNEVFRDHIWLFILLPLTVSFHYVILFYWHTTLPLWHQLQMVTPPINMAYVLSYRHDYWSDFPCHHCSVCWPVHSFLFVIAPSKIFRIHFRYLLLTEWFSSPQVYLHKFPMSPINHKKLLANLLLTITQFLLRSIFWLSSLVVFKNVSKYVLKVHPS